MTSDQVLINFLRREVADLKHKLAALCEVVSAVDETSTTTARGMLVLTSEVQRVNDKLKVTEQQFWGDAL